MRMHVVPAALLSLLLAACGGSSGKSGSNSSIPVVPGSSSSSVSSINNSSVASSSSSAAADTSSSQASEASSVSSATAPVLTGIFVDAAVENIGYRTETLSGVTNEAGEYDYREGEWVTFFIGDLELPAVPAGEIITPLNIADTDDINDVLVINIARLLQSLDVDGNPANGIRISSDIAQKTRLLDFSLPVDVFAQQPEIVELLAANDGAHTAMVSVDSALRHLEETLAFINGPSSSSSSMAVSSDGNTSESSSSVGGGAEVIFTETFEGATAENFYTTYRVNTNGQTLYKKAGGNPVFENGTAGLTGARFTIGEAGKDLDLSKPYTISFDVMEASGSGKVQIFIDVASTSGTRIFNENANTLSAGQRFSVQSDLGTAQSFIQIRAESSATLVFDNLVIEHTGAAGSSSSTSSSGNIGSSSSANSSTGGVSSTSSSSAVSSSSSSVIVPSIPPGTGGLTPACYQLATDPNTNWRETSLQSDQDIVKCLSDSLGKPVGYGENAKGGYDPNGNSKLTVIVKNHPEGKTVEEQISEAIADNEHNWIVFDKVDFRESYEIGLYRLHCGNPQIGSVLGITEAQCNDHRLWCAENNVSGDEQCLNEFFNKKLHNKNLSFMRNPVVGSNKTVDGRMSEAYFLFYGFMIGRDSSGVSTQKSNSVILTHLNFKGAGHTEDHEVDPDMIRVTGESNDVWIHKNTFDLTGDAAFDIKVGAYAITISFNKVVDVLRASLHGSSDSRVINTQITTTMHHNAFVTRDARYKTLGNTGRRVPLIRRGTSHMFNNVFVNYRKDILSIRVGAQLLWEDNALTVNQLHQEKSSLEASLSELQKNLVRDVNGGNYRGDGIYLWFSDAACNLDEATRTPLTASSGSVDNLSLHYSPASQAVINDQRLPAGQDLVDYVSATAGKHGQLPFNSPLAGNRSYVLGLGKVDCQ